MAASVTGCIGRHRRDIRGRRHDHGPRHDRSRHHDRSHLRDRGRHRAHGRPLIVRRRADLIAPAMAIVRHDRTGRYDLTGQRGRIDGRRTSCAAALTARPYLGPATTYIFGRMQELTRLTAIGAEGHIENSGTCNGMEFPER
jgi:hypothetical protein